MMSMKSVAVMLIVAGCVSSAYAQDQVVVAGKKIKMDYTLTVNNEQLESSVGKQPLEFVYGDQSIIPGLEKGIAGLKVGEEKVVTVEAKDAYGEVDPKALKEFPKDKMPNTVELKAGMVLEAQSPDGQNFPAVIHEIKGDKVVLDFNHPLAGKQLVFKIKILDISEASASVAQTPVAAAANNDKK